MPQSAPRSDAILPMTDDYMQQIVRGEKNYEFRRYRISPSVERIWFYLTAPFSHVAYICEIDPATTRTEDDEKLVEDGLGNKEFNDRHPDWNGYDFAYRIRSVFRIRDPISLSQLKISYGCKGAPRGLLYLPTKVSDDVDWRRQEPLIARESSLAMDELPPTVVPAGKRQLPHPEESGESQGASKKVRLSFIPGSSQSS